MDRVVKTLKSSATAGILVATFLLVFQPFQIRIQSWTTFYLVVGFGVVTFITSILVDLLFEKPILKYCKEHQVFIVTIALKLFFITLGNIVYNQLLRGYQIISMDLLDFLNVFLYTGLVGLVPISFFLITSYRNKQQEITAELLEKQNLLDATVKKDFVIFLGEGKKEKVQLELERVLYLQAQDNYVLIFYLEGERVCKEMIRTSLSKLEKQVANTSMHRCHRSFVINIKRVQAIKKHHQKLHIQLIGTSETIPVSKKYSEQIVRLFHKT